MTIFDNEEKIIEHAQTLLDDPQHQDSPMLPEFGELFRHYKRLYRQLRHVISLSDRQQLRLNVMNHELTDLNVSKDKFFSIIAHDLRGPLSSLIGLSEMLQEQVRTDASKALLDRSSDQIYSSTKDLYTLLENLLTWSQIQRGTIKYNPEMLELSEITKFAMRLFHAPAQQKQLQLINDVPSGTQVEMDYNMLNTVLRNLLSNAMKFTPPGGRITISATPSENGLFEVSVSDTGVGISPENQSKLFRFDQQYSGTGTAGEKGTGLGLNLCKEFVEQAGQTIWVESKPGEGTRFTFTLAPYSGWQSNTKEPLSSTVAEDSAKDLSQYRMLVVDDVAANRQALIDFLRPFGFRFREANNGQEALSIWQQWRPQMIWMDIRMPIMDGYASAKEIRASDSGQKTAMIAMTASITENEHSDVLEAGYDGLLHKPFQQKEVLELIEKHLKLSLNVQDMNSAHSEDIFLNKGLRPEDFAGLKPETLKRLDYIAKVFDMNVAHKLVEELRPENQRLADGLADLLNHFSFDRLQELLDQSRAL